MTYLFIHIYTPVLPNVKPTTTTSNPKKNFKSSLSSPKKATFPPRLPFKETQTPQPREIGQSFPLPQLRLLRCQGRNRLVWKDRYFPFGNGKQGATLGDKELAIWKIWSNQPTQNKKKHVFKKKTQKTCNNAKTENDGLELTNTLPPYLFLVVFWCEANCATSSPSMFSPLRAATPSCTSCICLKCWINGVKPGSLNRWAW